MENSPQWFLGLDVKGSTVGIVGLGNVGTAIAKRLKGFEVEKILYTGHSRKKAGMIAFNSIKFMLINSQSIFKNSLCVERLFTLEQSLMK